VKETSIHRLVITMLASALATAGYAQSQPAAPRSPSCTDEASSKKLAGAAKTSFMKKCETDAAAACDVAAADQKLSGAAKTSFTKSASRTLSEAERLRRRAS
jgi:hypothetical protein